MSSDADGGEPTVIDKQATRVDPDDTTVELCRKFTRGHCKRAQACAYRHVRTQWDRKTVPVVTHKEYKEDIYLTRLIRDLIERLDAVELPFPCRPEVVPEGMDKMWTLPKGLNPRDEFTGNGVRRSRDTHKALSARRGWRKQWQVESFAGVLDRILAAYPGAVKRVVDFGAASGNVGLPLAARYPDVTFVLMDMTAFAIDIAKSRAAEAGLTNVEFRSGLIEEWDGEFDLGLAVHCCGNATDFAQMQCIRYDAAFVLCPCCVGKLNEKSRNHRPTPTPVVQTVDDVQQPRSRWLRDVLSTEEYHAVAQHADHGGYDFDDERSANRRMCKFVLEADRGSYAVDNGYQVVWTKLRPLEASPKNDVLVGIPARMHKSSECDWTTAERVEPDVPAGGEKEGSE